jgi:hypothetical protein
LVYPGCLSGLPKFLREAVVVIHRLYAVQGQDTSVMDALSKESIVQGTRDPRINIRLRNIQGRMVMASKKSPDLKPFT